MENYKKATYPHVANDEVVTQEIHEKLQTLINAHAVSWVRMLNAGIRTENETRIKNSMISTDSPLPPLYTLRKDQKRYDDEHEGPPVRPVCGAFASYNHKLSHFITMILTKVWKTRENSSICMNTETMIAEMNRTNHLQHEGLIIGSADVVALYSSLDIDFTIDKVCEVFFESNVKIDGVDYEEVGLYLALNIKSELLKKIGIAEECPTRKSNK